MRTKLTPDILIDPQPTPDQVEQQVQQATALFNAALTSSGATPPPHAADPVGPVVDQAHKHYANELAQDLRRLARGLVEVEALLIQSYARIWQLLIEWDHLAARYPPAAPPSPSAAPLEGSWAPMQLLQRLQAEERFAPWIQQQAAGWSTQMLWVERWYHQWVKKDPRVWQPLTSTAQEGALLAYLIRHVIFKQEAIQAVFSHADLNWSVHQHVVKALLLQGLTGLKQHSEKSVILDQGDLCQEAGKKFYAHLVHRTLEKETELEGIMAQKTKNWCVDRIMLLDKIVIQLALCEMMYFPDIPVKVTINEYVALAQACSSPQSGRFVNGLLDAAAATLLTAKPTST